MSGRKVFRTSRGVEKYLESGSNNDATFLANCRSRSRLQGPISVSMVSEWRCFRANFQLYLWTTFTCICGQLSIVYVNNFHLYLWTTFTGICEQISLVFVNNFYLYLWTTFTCILWKKTHVLYACKILTKPKGLLKVS